ncbi:MAG: aldo/keto reductase [Clostridia bacterium]|nr:aldo/keto reductase [Clostridia bacterium]
MSRYFPEINKKLAFGLMRLPTVGDQIDYDQLNSMVDAFIQNGFNYFDTALPYHNGMSEVAFAKCVADRYPRDQYLLANKLSQFCFKTEADILPVFHKQLETCHVDYFDFYLLHALNNKRYQILEEMQAIQKCLKLKEEGKIRHLGFSFHDTADVLDQILTEHPELEFVQLQINYADLDDNMVQAQKCYDVAVKHNKPVMVMEPVKGGSLATLTPTARKVLDDLHGGSPASYAIRFCASLEQVEIVLSGMSNIAQLQDNIGYMKDFKPLTCTEYHAINQVRKIMKETPTIGCTTCKYCLEGCPKGIGIPHFFNCLNQLNVYGGDGAFRQYKHHVIKFNPASHCIGCRKCESVCPQKLPIVELLKTVAKTFE